MLQNSSFEVVLVHGAWADGSCWNAVISNLLDMGIRSSAVQLCLLSFDEDVAAVRRHLKTCSGKVLLVGHSYGGAVITQAGDDSRVAGLVYVAANAPAAGEPFGAFFARNPGAYQAQLAPDEHGFIRASAQTFAAGLAQDLGEKQRQMLVAVQKPMSAAIFGASVSIEAWRSKPRWYIVAADDRIIPSSAQRSVAQRIGAKVGVVPGGHLSPLSQSGAVTDILRGALSEL